MANIKLDRYDSYFVTIFDGKDEIKKSEKYYLKNDTILDAHFNEYLKFVVNLCEKYNLNIQRVRQFDEKDRSLGFYLINLINRDRIKLFYDGEYEGKLYLLIESEKKEEIKNYILKEVSAISN